MGNDKNLIDDFFNKMNAPGTQSKIKIAKPLGGDRDTTFEERRKQGEQENVKPSGAAGEGSAVNPEPVHQVQPVKEKEPETSGEEKRLPGRPRSTRGPVTNVNFLLEVDVKQKLDRLKLDLCRSSSTDLIKEALHDLFKKYGV